jgi:hypothetical protein
MRASEFVVEQKGKVSKRHRDSSKGLHVFSKSLVQFDRLYDLNRVMMAAATTDGTFVPKMDDESWVGKNLSAHAYSKADHDKLHKAYQAAGMDHVDLNNGDIESKEVESTYKISPIKPFKGFK